MTDQDIRMDLLKAQRALANARQVPVREVLGEINEAKGYIDKALRAMEEDHSPK